MKKIIICIILLLVTIIMMVGCSNKIRDLNSDEANIGEEINIPELGIVFDTENITVEKGGYSWNYDGKSVIVDAASPNQIAENMTGNKIEPNAELTFKFSEAPNKLTVVDWSEIKNNLFDFNNDKIIAPKEKGTYIYEIIGEWEEGQVSFTIKLIVV